MAEEKSIDDALDLMRNKNATEKPEGDVQKYCCLKVITVDVTDKHYNLGVLTFSIEEKSNLLQLKDAVVLAATQLLAVIDATSFELGDK